MLRVVYRMCDIPSTNPSPILQEDKQKLNQLCLKSFIDGFRDIIPELEIHFICDNCPKSYGKWIDEVCQFNYSIEYTTLGINGTMLYAYDQASRWKGRVLFQECDYLYRPGIGKLFCQAIDELALVSPYDHLNFYLDSNIHSPTCDVCLVGNHHFRTTERNTMTWGCNTSLVRAHKDILDKYGYLDDQVWNDLLIAGYQLHTPIRAFATHMVEGFLSPSVNWEEIWKKYL